MMLRVKPSLLHVWLQRACVAVAVFTLMGAGGVTPSKEVIDRVTLKGIPHVAQLPNYCGPAALSSLFTFWGKSVSQNVIGQKVYDRRYGATNGADLLLFAREEGFSAYTYFSSLQDLKAQLRAGYPVMILQEMSLKDDRGHFRVVIGYNDQTRSFQVRDTNYSEVRSLSYDEFDETWAPFGRWSLLVCPKEKETGLSAAVKNNPVLHLDLGQAYVRRNQTRLARQHFEETLRLEPRNEEAIDQLSLLMGAGPSSEKK